MQKARGVKGTQTRCVDLGGGKWEHEEVVCERLVTRHGR